MPIMQVFSVSESLKAYLWLKASSSDSLKASIGN